MQLGRVCGQVVSTKKTDKLNGFKILVVQPVSLETFEDKGAPFVSLDGIGAGSGELVMCVSGSSSRQTAETDARPVDNLIVAIIDSVDILGERMFDKADPSVKPGCKKNDEVSEADISEKNVCEEKSAGIHVSEAKAEEVAVAEPVEAAVDIHPSEKELMETDISSKKTACKSVPAPELLSEEEKVETNLDLIIQEWHNEKNRQDIKPQVRKKKPKH